MHQEGMQEGMSQQHAAAQLRPAARPSKNAPAPRMGCDKAARRLRASLTRAERLGLGPGDVASLPAAKRIVSHRDHDWKLAVLLLLMFGGGVIVALVCTTSRGCTRIEDINLAT